MLNIKRLGVFLFLAVIWAGVNPCMADDNVKFSQLEWALYPDGVNVKFQLDDKISADGHAFGKLTIPDSAARFAVYAYVTMQEKRNYKVTFSYKMKGIQMSGACRLEAVFNFKRRDGGNGSAGTLKVPWNFEKDQKDWQTFSTEISAPPDTELCQLAIIQASGISGVIWFGDVKVEEVNDVFAVYKTEAPPMIDGKLDDECWQKAVPLRNFYLPENNAIPAKIATTAYISYDDNNFYIAFKNDEPAVSSIRSQVKERDGNVWNDDCNEVFITAPNGITCQFLANSVNGQCDARIFAKVPGDPYTADIKWNGTWGSAASKEKDSWTTEICIPAKNFQAKITNGSTWHINLARERKLDTEISHFNRVADNFNNVMKFSILEFAEAGAKLTRYSEAIIKEPLKITRTSPKYKELLSEKPGNYGTSVWASECVLNYYPPKVKGKYTVETFAKEQENILSEYGQAGIAGPSFPFLPNYISGGMETVKKYNDEYKLKFWLALFSSGHGKEAIARGATYVSQNAVDPNDPLYQEVIIDFIKSYCSKIQPQLPYLAFILGNDEPMNHVFEAYSMTLNEKNKDALVRLDEKIKKQFGFGKFGLHDAYAKNDPNIIPFNMIAFMKWWNNAFMENTSAQRESARKYAPGIPFISHNMNCVRGMGKEDVSLLSANTDYASADPYPTSAMYNFGKNRGLYHTGFTIKFLKDLSGNKPTAGFIQAFRYCGHSPSPSDIREWASQALKNGANRMMWFTSGEAPPSRVDLPDTYKELLRLGNIIHKMNKLKIPEVTKTAILFSNPSFIGNDDEAVHSWYTTYSILGENLKTWFRFVSDSGLRLGMDNLSRYKLVYVPQIKYTDRDTAEALLEYVKNGGKVVLFDPEAFTWNVDGTSLDTFRNELIGCVPGKPVIATDIMASDDYSGLKKGNELPLTPLANKTGSVLAFEITPPADAKVIANYPDGKPAAFERNIGKGTLLYFAAQPFGNSDLAVKNSPWSAFMKAQAEQVGEKLDLPIWDFELPATGGEIEVKYVIKPDAK